MGTSQVEESKRSPSADSKNAVDLANVSKEYSANGNIIRALDAVTLTLARAQTAIVLGPSGAGKTTLLNLVAAGISTVSTRSHQSPWPPGRSNRASSSTTR